MKVLFRTIFFFCLPFIGMAQTMVLFTEDLTPPPPPPPSSSFTATFTGQVAYLGQSPIDSRGIGYYNESIPSTTTIQVEIRANRSTESFFTLTASHPDGLTFFYLGPMYVGTRFYPMRPFSSYTPDSFDETGTLTMTLTHSDIQGSATLEPRIDVKSLPGKDTAVQTISVGGHVWMDRPLGAHRRATHLHNDIFAKASFYQWGRASDGHEVWVTDGDNPQRRVPFNNLLAEQHDIPPDARIILNYLDGASGAFVIPDDPYARSDWRVTPYSYFLWQTAAAVNNPCPDGFRVPTEPELTDFARASMPNGYNSHTSNPPYVSSHGQSYLFRVNNSPIPKASVAFFPNSSLYSSSQEEPTALNNVNHVQFKFVDLDVTNTSNFRRKIDPRFVMRCIQN